MNLNTKKQSNNRNSNVELLRILCIISIILHHSYYHSDFSNATTSFNYLILYLIGILGIISNDIFILITGYYAVNSNIKLRNIIKLVLESIFYSYAIMIIYTIITGELNPNMIIDSLTPIIHNSNWFITCYILLYISIPFINILIQNIDKKQYSYLLLIAITIFSILPSLGLLNQYYSSYVWFVIVYLVGAYIKKYNCKKLVLKNDLLFMFSSISLAIVLIAKRNWNVGLIIGINNFIMFILGLSIFVEFINRKMFYNKYINYISSSVLGIYLIHDNFIIRPIIWQRANLKAYIDKPYFWIYEISIILIIFLSCFIIDKIRQICVEKPILKIIDNIILKKQNNKNILDNKEE